jgi:hypothetical protein
MIVKDRQVAHLPVAAPQFVEGDQPPFMGGEWRAGGWIRTQRQEDERKELGFDGHPVDGGGAQVAKFEAGQATVDAENVAPRAGRIGARERKEDGAED